MSSSSRGVGSSARVRVRLSQRLTQQRRKAPAPLAVPRSLVVAVPDMHSQVNLSRIMRGAALFGVPEILTCGRGRFDRTVSRGSEDHISLRTCRTLAHPLMRLRRQGWLTVGLEQTERSESLFTFSFPERCVLVLGHERHGLTDDLIALCDHVVEIPTYGTLEGSHNASTAALMAMYEYVKQHGGAGGSASGV